MTARSRAASKQEKRWLKEDEETVLAPGATWTKRLRLTPHVAFTSKGLREWGIVRHVLLDCLKTEDLDSFRDVFIAHMLTTDELDRTQLDKVAEKISKQLQSVLGARRRQNRRKRRL